ncbi:DUF883 family protein [Bdellovibrio svalbardensis]|uniref:DUF883 domain-containing protein n=1 Tax=Bdellovibrio svalbardensis TaxID=2972972 RepID=A0ABT6DHQ4_9BACT|nr:hypothetical protein [Bdellovibrio svalbardensis]MDG0816039.1 hypothetical protein [Bdellovibrio svalbardensis]
MAESSRELVNDMKSTGKQALETGKSIYSDAKSEIKSHIGEAKSDLRAQLNDRYESIKHKAQDAVSTSEDFVKEHPIATVLGACAVGFVAGLIARRTRH